MTTVIEHHEDVIDGYKVEATIEQDGDDLVSSVYIENEQTGASASLGWAEDFGELTDGTDGDESIDDSTVRSIRDWVESVIDY